MGLLFDTNVLIWLVTENHQMSKRVVRRMTEDGELLYISSISGWEYGQKRQRYPKQLPISFDDLISGLPYIPLDFAFACHRFAESLPPIHRDPADRKIIAQAIYHDLTLIASDATMRQYPVRSFW